MPRLLYTGETVTWMREDTNGVATEFTETEYDAWEANAQAIDATLLADRRIEANASIDAAAERARLRHVTGGAGQAMTYRAKAEEARAYKDAGYPADMTNYPFIDAEATSTSQTATVVANGIIAQEDAWKVTGASIEGARMGGKTNVASAADIGDVEIARTAAVAALDAI